jgi:hypothetical protein
MPPRRSKTWPPNSKKSKSAAATHPVVSEKQKNALSSMFKRIESSDSLLKTCPQCSEQVKSCLLTNHLKINCTKRVSGNFEPKSPANCTDDDVLIVEELSTKKLKNIQNKQPESAKKELFKTEAKENHEILIADDEDIAVENQTKRCKTEPVEESSSQILNKFMDQVSEANLKPVEVKREVKVELSLTPVETSLSTTSSVCEVKSEPSEVKIDYYLQNFTNALEAVLSEKTFCCLLDPGDYETIDRFSNLSSMIFF